MPLIQLGFLLDFYEKIVDVLLFFKTKDYFGDFVSI